MLLANVALNLLIGSWTGMRLMEYRRFRVARRDEGEAPTP